MLTVDASLLHVKDLVHHSGYHVLQAALNAVKGSLMMLFKRLEIQVTKDLQPQQPAFKVGTGLPLHVSCLSACACHACHDHCLHHNTKLLQSHTSISITHRF